MPATKKKTLYAVLCLLCLFQAPTVQAGALKVAGSAGSIGASAAELEGRIERIMQEREPGVLEKLDAEFVSMITTLHNEGRLKPVLFEAGKRLQAEGKLPERITADNLQEFTDRLDGMIDAELQARGKTTTSQGTRYRSWAELATDQLSRVRQSAVRPAGPGAPSAFADPKFLSELAQVARTRFFATEKALPLINGPASFPLRKSLMEGAKKKIHVLTWAFEDDVTGTQFANLLVRRFRDGVDVKVMVDWKTAQLSGYHKSLEVMERAGVPVVRWQDPQRAYFGLHRKVLIVDDEHVVAGGMNFGDVYSHMGEEKTPKWRDTDLYLKGAAAVEAEALFASLWNDQVSGRKLPLAQLAAPAARPAALDPNLPSVAIIDHAPNTEGEDPIMLAVLKAIEGATSSVDIANAYYISNPALERALLDARKRGVRVRVFTNSADSVDVPMIAKPIVNSLPPLAQNGVEVYLKTGATLHSKVMVVDGVASFVMSYNFHPQSLRTQGEVAFLVLDRKVAGELTRAFQDDIAGANKVKDPEAIRIKPNLLDFIVVRYFFDQL